MPSNIEFVSQKRIPVSGKWESTLSVETRLEDFLNYYSEKDAAHISIEMLDIVATILTEVSKECEPLRTLAQEVAIDIASIRAEQEFKPQSFFKKIKSSVIAPLKKLQRQQRLGQLVSRMRAEKKGEGFFLRQEDAIQARVAEMQAGEFVAETAKQVDELSPGEIDLVEKASNIVYTSDDVLDMVIDTQISRNDQETSDLFYGIKILKEQLFDQLAGDSSLKIVPLLAQNKQLIKQLAGGKTPQFMKRFALLRIPAYWRRQRESIYEELKGLFSKDNIRICLAVDMARRGVIEEDAEDKLHITAHYLTLQSRMAYIENAQKYLPDEWPESNEQIVRAAVLEDFLKNNVIASSFLADMVRGKQGSEDVALYSSLDWLFSTTGAMLENTESENRLNLREVVQKIKQGVGLALVVSLEAMQAVAVLASYLPLFRLSPNVGLLRGGSLPKADFEGLFEGASLLSKKKLMSLNGFPPRQGMTYFRRKSFSTLNLETGGWEDNSAVSPDLVCPLAQRSPDTGVHFYGDAGVKSPRRKNGFVEIAIPYGTVPYRLIGQDGEVHTSFNQKDNGVLGADLSSDSHYMHQTFSKRGEHHIEYYQADVPLLDQYPASTQELLTPIVTSLDQLPADIRTFLGELDAYSLSQEEEAQKIMSFIRDNWIYSLDTRNGRIFSAALKQGADQYVRKMFTHRFAKCTGSATIAAALLRLRNIPARVAEGFIVGPDADVVTAMDAHAWVEYIADGQLIWGDPTPYNLDDQAKQTFARSEFFGKIFGMFDSLKNKRMSFVEWKNMRRINEVRLNRILRMCVPEMQRIVLYHLDYFDKKQLAVQDVKAKRDKITELEEFVLNNRKALAIDDLLQRIEKLGLIEENQVRKQMLLNNMEKMFIPALSHFLDQVIEASGGEFFNKDFLEKWDGYVRNWNVTDEIFLLNFTHNFWHITAYHFSNTIDAEMLDDIAQYPAAFIQKVLLKTVRRILDMGTMAIKRKTNRRKIREWEADCEVQIQRLENLFSEDRINTTVLIPLVSNSVTALQMLT